jgi:hypothetical protein
LKAASFVCFFISPNFLFFDAPYISAGCHFNLQAPLLRDASLLKANEENDFKSFAYV